MSRKYNDQEVTLYDLVSRLGVEYNEKSGYTRCICPGCVKPSSNKKTLHLDFDKNRWRCVKCEQSGGVLRFYTGYV